MGTAGMMSMGHSRVHLVRLFLILLITLLAPVPAAVAATDCAVQFAPGAYGVPATDPAVRAGLLTVAGFRPIYLEKRSVEEADPAVCVYVTAYDVFRLSYQEPRPLLAGCYGDFNGDGRRDYALLLQGAGGEVIPHVFLAVPPRYRVFALPKVTDPYGFNEDRTLWPGPFCQKKPANGQFKFLESGSVHVVGDVIQVGWYGYYWSPDTVRFEAVLIQD
jgi:hypothetical protein